MKNIVALSLIILFMFSCKQESSYPAIKPYEVKAPKADISYTLGANGSASINFSFQKGDAFLLDFGNGEVIKDTIRKVLVNYGTWETQVNYKANGSYNVKLTVSNQKGVDSQQKLIYISSVTPKPFANFTYETGTDGMLKTINMSALSTNYEWRLIKKGEYAGYTSKAESPDFIIENNGTYYLYLTAFNQHGVTHSRRDSLIVTNARNTNRPTFEGAFFDKTGKLNGEGMNTFDEGWGMLMVSGNSCYNFVIKDVGSIFIVNGNSWRLTQEERYSLLKNKLITGPVDRKDWTILFRQEKPIWSGIPEGFNLNRAPDSIFEIEEVKEIEQPRLFPELKNKAFLVTFRIKVDLGVKGKIDGKLKVRYLIY